NKHQPHVLMSTMGSSYSKHRAESGPTRKSKTESYNKDHQNKHQKHPRHGLHAAGWWGLGYTGGDHSGSHYGDNGGGGGHSGGCDGGGGSGGF
ncbi:hypothetical protein BGZ73_009159, partial [Actinomortierella ambigua]